VLAAAAFALQLALSRKRPATVGSFLGATAVGVASAWLGVGSLARFLSHRTTINPATPGATYLVTSGPNRVTRNPMYLGLAGMLTAHAIWRRSPWALIPAALFALAIDRFQVPGEESVLRERFGAEYERYVSSTPRWLGQFR
ncbi:MAG TPA: isoprenylcysteine carboxylmethyltransferase family protein, partial [Terrimesophilobacter sp.]|nr:isoprenylcysteine carboxylmethyltransferase family protein [Terrimesophilobacter sp.]